MRSFLAILLGLGWSLTAVSQTYPIGDNGMVAPAPWTPAQLDQIFAPIALYPDALVALILPAATEPADIARAAGYLSANGDLGQLDNQPWDDSVKSLAHYPDLVKWMDSNPAWSQQAGDAFLAQPAEVMKSVQRLRSQAIASGALVDTPQQDVITTETEIRIVPARPDVIYIPYYQPDIFYPDRRGAGWRMSFSPPLRIGAWLNYDLDWDRHGIWAGSWYPGWDFRHPAWRNTTQYYAPTVGHSWHPTITHRPARPFVENRPLPSAPVPAPIQRAQAAQAPALVQARPVQSELRPPTVARPVQQAAPRGHPVPANPPPQYPPAKIPPHLPPPVTPTPTQTPGNNAPVPTRGGPPHAQPPAPSGTSTSQPVPATPATRFRGRR